MRFFRTYLISFFLCLSTGSWSQTTGEKIISALRLQGFDCQEKTASNCGYSECLGQLAVYPRPLMILLPQSVKSLRLHFHGHKLYKFPEYDQDLKSMIKAFGIAADICRSEEIVVIPESSGNNTDYDQQLGSHQQMENFWRELQQVTGQQLKDFPLHLSAHSGGGRTVGRWLEFKTKVQTVTIFDGVYSETQKKQLKTWYEAGKGELDLYAIQDQAPYRYNMALIKEWELPSRPEQVTIKNETYQQIQAPRLRMLHRKVGKEGAIRAHYQILSETWKLDQSR